MTLQVWTYPCPATFPATVTVQTLAEYQAHPPANAPVTKTPPTVPLVWGQPLFQWCGGFGFGSGWMFKVPAPVATAGLPNTPPPGIPGTPGIPVTPGTPGVPGTPEIPPVTAAPEPSTFLLVMLSLCIIVAAARRWGSR